MATPLELSFLFYHFLKSLASLLHLATTSFFFCIFCLIENANVGGLPRGVVKNFEIGQGIVIALLTRRQLVSSIACNLR